MKLYNDKNKVTVNFLIGKIIPQKQKQFSVGNSDVEAKALNQKLGNNVVIQVLLILPRELETGTLTMAVKYESVNMCHCSAIQTPSIIYL